MAYITMFTCINTDESSFLKGYNSFFLNIFYLTFSCMDPSIETVQYMQKRERERERERGGGGRKTSYIGKAESVVGGRVLKTTDLN